MPLQKCVHSSPLQHDIKHGENSGLTSLRAEKELGLEIPDEAITQMEQHLTLTLQDWKTAEQEEKIRR